MGISTVSFNQAGIYKNKMVFALYGKDNTFSRVFDNKGKHIFDRISYIPQKKYDENGFVISRKNQYFLPDNSIVYEFIDRMYDKTGRLLDIIKKRNKY